MNIIIKIFTAIFYNILSKPEFFMGLLVFVGYLLLKKRILEALAGALKATIGYMILQIGAGGMVKGFNPILNGLLKKYSLSASVIDSNFGFAAANSALEAAGRSLSSTMFVLLIGFAVNIVLVLLKKITKVRTLYTTGHIMVKQAGFITWMILFALPQLQDTVNIIIIGVLIGLYWAIFSNLTVEATQNLTEGERVFAVGHAQMLGIWITDKIAGKLGKKEDNVENINLPSNFKVLSDNIVGTSLVMLIMFGTVLLVLGQETMAEFDGGALKNISYISYVISKSLSFTVNFIILQTGVKMLVAEVTTSFDGISGKLLKGAIPAVDCAATYGFASSNTLIIGFLFGFLGQLVAILGLVVFRSPILIISGFVPLFFDNATLAVFANKRGGKRAAMIIPFVSGMTQVLLGAIGVMAFELAAYGGWYGNLDISTIWLPFGIIIKNLSIIGVILVGIIMLIIPQIQYHRNKENYF
ncbi:PTS ascorbate transporter subunit IIC [Clostridiales bacterium COT073_COT-073]|nr:PTS ascorbate transporter subunit IIC [Clostridiales bacterium COT073_COT-073]